MGETYLGGLPNILSSEHAREYVSLLHGSLATGGDVNSDIFDYGRLFLSIVRTRMTTGIAAIGF